MAAAIEVTNLHKSYGDFQAVNGVDLRVEEGEILAFLGPNGAGKTTTIEILEGYRNRDSGEVLVLGEDPQRAPLSWRERIGIVLQESEPVPELTALETVKMHSTYYAKPRNPAEVLDIVGLTDSADHRTRKLSGGQKRRLDLALALVGNPDLVFLDEPTTGFDPSARRESWGMIEALRQLGSTVLLTTHYMDEAEQLADRIVVIAGGVIVAKGSAEELATQVGAKTRISWRKTPDAPEPPGQLGALPGTEVAGALAEDRIIATDDIVPALHALTSWAMAENIELPELNVARPTLEDIYLALTGAAENGAGESAGAEEGSRA